MKKSFHSLENLNKKIKDDLDFLKLEKKKFTSFNEKKKSFSSLSSYSNETAASKRVAVKKKIISARSSHPKSVKTSSLPNKQQLKRHKTSQAIVITSKTEPFKYSFYLCFKKISNKPRRRYGVGAANAAAHAAIHFPNARLHAKIAAGVPAPAKKCQ